MKKIKIAISACLLGQAVRYDAKEKKQAQILDFFLHKVGKSVEIVPFCPEVAIGLGVPRPKIQLVRQVIEGKGEQNRVLGVENHTQDVTEALQSYAHHFLQQHSEVRHFIVKAKSPSCGYQTTPLMSTVDSNDYEQIALSSGMFVQTVLQMRPEIIIVDEIQLSTEYACAQFYKTVL